jgi:hypothetical protein
MKLVEQGDCTEGNGVGGSERKSYSTDICTYTHTFHIKDQGKEAVNWMNLDVLYIFNISYTKI